MKFVLKAEKCGRRLTGKESPKGRGCFVILEKHKESKQMQIKL